MITYTGGSTQEGQFTDESTTITADQSEDATLVLTDADFCTTETTVSADDLTSLLDTRDGQRYQIVTIGTQTWLAENFNYDYSGSLCYDDDAANCEEYGKLYNHIMITADDFAPEGWKVPSKNDYQTLIDFIGGDGSDLMVGGSSKFEGQLSGQYNSADKEFRQLDQYGWFASSTKITEFSYTQLLLGFGDQLARLDNIFNEIEEYPAVRLLKK
ncbi:hypothetical protein BFP72_06145 [Reichenbachiella sp. 5M10]|uniref:FISUMP domain-containing protein n=1 Tax=Reichenbachiella sp. 5M10 TaxID=1889772 RepID=UPI000C62C8B6|nr:FISUMP domain-containing protein [Reichenbachiella sp. 5M10]PIB35002.1 hypothetical protein BFP72_06145 [Reichenbachiella sp. 5M10]